KNQPDPRGYYDQADGNRYAGNGPFPRGTGHLLSDQMGRSPRADRAPREQLLVPIREQQLHPRDQQERKGLLGKGLFGAREADKNGLASMNKIEFNGRDERGVVKQLWLPDGFRADAENDQTERLYTKDDTASRFSIYGGRDLSADETKSLQAI